MTDFINHYNINKRPWEKNYSKTNKINVIENKLSANIF